jgi:hypothetical protein
MLGIAAQSRFVICELSTVAFPSGNMAGFTSELAICEIGEYVYPRHVSIRHVFVSTLLPSWGRYMGARKRKASYE